MMRRSANITPFAAGEKIRKWCAYQERSQHDARMKLREYGMNQEQTEAIIAELIGENFLNEERFALAFASGKFRMKNWGKIKIRNELRQHKVSETCIRRALQTIDDKEYEAVLEKVLDKKSRLIKLNDQRKAFYSLLNYAVGKGFEAELVSARLKLPRE